MNVNDIPNPEKVKVIPKSYSSFGTSKSSESVEPFDELTLTNSPLKKSPCGSLGSFSQRVIKSDSKILCEIAKKDKDSIELLRKYHKTVIADFPKKCIENMISLMIYESFLIGKTLESKKSSIVLATKLIIALNYDDNAHQHIHEIISDILLEDIVDDALKKRVKNCCNIL
jgi:hypothetical protein